MKARYFHLMQFNAYLLLSLFTISIPLWANLIDVYWGIVIAGILGFAFALLAWKHYKKAKVAREEDRVLAPPTDATTEQQIDFYSRNRLIGTIACLLLSIYIIYELNALESDEEYSAMLWAPIAFVYEHWGYWPAISVMPALCLLILVLSAIKLRQLHSKK